MAEKKIFGFTVQQALLAAGGVFAIIEVKKFIDKGAGAFGVNSDENNTAGLKLKAWNPNYYKGVKKQPWKDYNKLAGDIHQYPGIFWDSFSTVMNVLKQLTTKAQVSQLTDAFAIKYTGGDLYTYLVDGGGFLPADGLSNEHLSQVNKYVTNLPDF